MQCLSSEELSPEFQSPQWGSNSKAGNFLRGLIKTMFQSPQWGSNSKEQISLRGDKIVAFQSPQWGSNSKGKIEAAIGEHDGFSPRNGEVILKSNPPYVPPSLTSFSPRNGEVILKLNNSSIKTGVMEFQSPQWGSNSKEKWTKAQFEKASFSPRNGEVILKSNLVLTSRNLLSFSPRNGEVILKPKFLQHGLGHTTFQSPQWGSNSKEEIF